MVGDRIALPVGAVVAAEAAVQGRDAGHFVFAVCDSETGAAGGVIKQRPRERIAPHLRETLIAVSIEEKLKKQVEEYELKLKEISQNAEKQRIEQERLNQERKLKEKIEQLEEEKAKKKREFEIKEKNEMLKREQAKKQQEFIHKSEKLENNLTLRSKEVFSLREVSLIIDGFYIYLFLMK